jgi:hypothetical protein
MNGCPLGPEHDEIAIDVGITCHIDILLENTSPVVVHERRRIKANLEPPTPGLKGRAQTYSVRAGFDAMG